MEQPLRGEPCPPAPDHSMENFRQPLVLDDSDADPTPGPDREEDAEREYALAKIERGMEDIGRRRTMPHKDAVRLFSHLAAHDRSRVRWTTEAYADLRAIREFIERDSPRYAALVLHRIVANMEAAERYTDTLTPTKEHPADEVVELALGSYRLICCRRAGEIIVLTVLSSAHLLP